MNIIQAIRRVETLTESVDSAHQAAVIIGRNFSDHSDVVVTLNVGNNSARTVFIKKKAMLEILDETIRANEEEMDKIKPVIDMANAALKGVLGSEA